MNTVVKMVAVVLIAAGTYALAKGGISYTTGRRVVHVSGSRAVILTKKTYVVPRWLAIWAIAGGTFVLIAAFRQKV
ncbi:MAG: hypothetical protein ACRD3T_05450 [Terriglobia bacterium]